MQGSKSEMAFLLMNKEEFEDMIMREVRARYPALLADKRWEWEDAYVSKDVFDGNFPADKIALELVFTKREESLDKACPCGVDSVCR